MLAIMVKKYFCQLTKRLTLTRGMLRSRDMYTNAIMSAKMTHKELKLEDIPTHPELDFSMVELLKHIICDSLGEDQLAEIGQ